MINFSNHPIPYTLKWTSELNPGLAFTGVELCKLSYYTPTSEMIKELNLYGLDIKEFIETPKTNLLLLHYKPENFYFFIFTGTKDYSWDNIFYNWQLYRTLWRGGWVHSGFLFSYYQIKSHIEDLLITHEISEKIVWAGHSRGGTIATLACSDWGKGVVYSYGSPRFGCCLWREANRHVPHWRFVLEGDPIQFLPPRVLGYKHHGIRVLLPEIDFKKGSLSDFTSEELTRDWGLIRTAFREWARGNKVGRRHWNETYCDLLKRYGSE